MRLEISRNGEVDSAYPDHDGAMRGRIDASGDIRGIWTRPRSDQPCREARGGTRAWGTVSLAGIDTRRPMGLRLCCVGEPNRDWKMQR